MLAGSIEVGLFPVPANALIALVNELATLFAAEIVPANKELSKFPLEFVGAVDPLYGHTPKVPEALIILNLIPLCSSKIPLSVAEVFIEN